jgi:hypothetical protein
LALFGRRRRQGLHGQLPRRHLTHQLLVCALAIERPALSPSSPLLLHPLALGRARCHSVPACDLCQPACTDCIDTCMLCSSMCIDGRLIVSQRRPCGLAVQDPGERELSAATTDLTLCRPHTAVLTLLSPRCYHRSYYVPSLRSRPCDAILSVPPSRCRVLAVPPSQCNAILAVPPSQCRPRGAALAIPSSCDAALS